MTHSVDLGGRTLHVELIDVDEAVCRLVPLRIATYVKPHAATLFSRLEAASGAVLPDVIPIRFTGSPRLVRSADDWHKYLPNGDRSGVRTVERILVQAAAGALARHGETRELHAFACPIVADTIDITFICALELLA